ncbi:S-layer homology domain-containing protein [Petrocella sp. FN5]|uniref:S-layer homology domain-containing protein n=1 Tax=Petrocella sp. FN5 TaxID=3032002 RepID=UPI0023D97A66|nr:S-layer homology domain-containing protein [Petrocella sp. FN5]MDF1616874.1 S-layer homology domain-containing protein [Petrocella sp. FN5]
MKKIIVMIMIMALALSVNTDIKVHAMGESNFIAAGWGTTFFVKEDGSLWGYGKNDQGLLRSELAYIEEPKQLLEDVKSISVNRYAVLVVKNDDTLWYWGRLPSHKKTIVPIKILEGVAMATLDGYNNQLIFVLKTDGTLLQLNKTMFESVFHSSKVKFITIGGYNRFLINEADELWGWNDISNTTYGALGVGHTEPMLQPVKILENVEYVVGDLTSTMIIKKDGTLWMCGRGNQGRFFDGTKEINGPILEPVKIMENVMHVALRDTAFFVIKNDYTIWTWGKNNNYGLGMTHLSSPVIWTTDVYNMTVGYQHQVVLKSDGTLWTGGRRDGVYKALHSTQNVLRQSATGLVDVPASWAVTEVREAENIALIPNFLQMDYAKTINRSEFCTLAITSIEVTMGMTIEAYLDIMDLEMPSKSPFEDVAALTETSRRNILAAYALGIVEGTSETTFEPKNPITREQAAKMLTATAAALNMETEATLPVFEDGSLISEWAKPYIGYMFDTKIMGGVGENRFDPKGGFQRQQAFMTVLRLNKITKN